MKSVHALLLLACVASPAVAGAQDALVLAPPQTEALVEELERPPGADVLRLGVQFDVEKTPDFFTVNFAGTAVWRPSELAFARDGLGAGPEIAARLRSPVDGTETAVAHRTLTSGPEISLGGAWTATARLLGVVWAHLWIEGAIGIQQGAIPREEKGADGQPLERRLTAGVLSGGPRAGVRAGPALLTVDLAWHGVWFGAETFPVYEETLEDGPYLGLSLVLRFSSHLFVHFRVLPTTDDLLPDDRWVVGFAASFDPFHD